MPVGSSLLLDGVGPLSPDDAGLLVDLLLVQLLVVGLLLQEVQAVLLGGLQQLLGLLELAVGKEAAGLVAQASFLGTWISQRSNCFRWITWIPGKPYFRYQIVKIGFFKRS